MSLLEITNRLPYTVREKMLYYLEDVRNRLGDIALEEGKVTIIDEIKKETEIIFLIKFLYDYFVVGFHNYDRMLSFFSDKGVNGFQIGGMVYARDESFSLEWRQMAGEIERLITEFHLNSYIKQTRSIDEIIRYIIQNYSQDERSSD